MQKRSTPLLYHRTYQCNMSSTTYSYLNCLAVLHHLTFGNYNWKGVESFPPHLNMHGARYRNLATDAATLSYAKNLAWMRQRNQLYMNLGGLRFWAQNTSRTLQHSQWREHLKSPSSCYLSSISAQLKMLPQVEQMSSLSEWSLTWIHWGARWHGPAFWWPWKTSMQSTETTPRS